jgi:hypothetical protein
MFLPRCRNYTSWKQDSGVLPGECKSAYVYRWAGRQQWHAEVTSQSLGSSQSVLLAWSQGASRLSFT